MKQRARESPPDRDPNDPTARYAEGLDEVYVARCGNHAGGNLDSLAIAPATWGSIEYALPVGQDSFAVADRPSRTVVLERSARGSVAAIRTTGFGLPAHLARIRDGSLLADELLFDDRADRVDGAVQEAAQTSPSATLGLVSSLFLSTPSRRTSIANALRELSNRRSSDTLLLEELVDEMAMTGRLAEARSAYRRLTALGASDTVIQRDSQLFAAMDAPTDSSVDAAKRILAPPTPAERSATWREISARQRQPDSAWVLARSALEVHGDSFAVAIVVHRERNVRHLGALITPVHPLPECCATIVDLKGISPRYPPLVLDHGPPSLRLLGSVARAYAFVVPAMPGETIRLADRSFTAEGDRRDAWDGGAEDALALLHATAFLDRRVQARRTCVFGRSRGGAVALLVAERDSTLRCVVAISPPADWFDAMWSDNWPPRVVLARALRGETSTVFTAGQFVDWFISPLSHNTDALAAERRRMLASSPLYFAEHLPPTLAFSGREDFAVPVANANRLRSLAARAAGGLELHIASMAGHDSDPVEIVRLVPRFLATHLGTPAGQRFPGADAR